MDIADLELNEGETNTERFEKLHSKTRDIKYHKIEREILKTSQKEYASDVMFMTQIIDSTELSNWTEAETEALNITYSLEYKWFKIASAFERVLKNDGMPVKVNKIYTLDDNLPWTNKIKNSPSGVECVLESVVTKEYLKGVKVIHKTAAKGLTCLTHAKSYFKTDKYRQGLGLMLEAMQYYGMLTIQLRDLETQVGRAQLEHGKNNNGGKKPTLIPVASYVQRVIDNYLIRNSNASDTEVFTYIINRLGENHKPKTSENVESTKTDFDELKEALSTLKEEWSENDNKTNLTLKLSTLRKWKQREIIKI